MIVNKLEIRNFKSIKKLDIDCSKINIFIGEPNSGKSNILESLGLVSNIAYFKYITTEQSFISQHFVRYSTAYNLYYDNDVSNTIKIRINSYEFNISSFENGHELYLERIVGKELEPKKLIKFIIREDGIADYRYFDERLMTYETDLLDFIKRIKFYRYKPLERYSNKNPAFILPPYGSNQLAILQTHPEIHKSIANILEPFGLELYLRPYEGTIELVKKKNGMIVGFPLKLTAETLQRLIFLLSIIKSNKESCIIVEEPETHLFPYYTKYLAELIVNSKNNNQYFFSTHNPYFLTTILEKAKTEDIAVFVTRYSNFETIITELSKSDISDILDSEDPFFNIEKYYTEDKEK